MASIFILLTSLFSLFFSFIFATKLFQSKDWSNGYIFSSLFFFSIASLCLFSGHVFTWYAWTVAIFSLTYVLVFPNLLGMVIYHLSRQLFPMYTLQVMIGYTSLLFILVLSVLTQVNSHDSLLETMAQAQVLVWVREGIPLFHWLTGFSVPLFVVASFWLWLRGNGQNWLWFACSGLIFLLADQLVAQQVLGLFSFSLLWLICLGFLGKAFSINFPLEKIEFGGESSWKEV